MKWKNLVCTYSELSKNVNMIIAQFNLHKVQVADMCVLKWQQFRASLHSECLRVFKIVHASGKDLFVFLEFQTALLPQVKLQEL